MTQFVFISHGGGPLPLLGDPNHVELIQYLRQLSQDLEALKQILVISAHWEASEIQITHHSNPPLLYTSRLYFRLLSLNRVSTIAPSKPELQSAHPVHPALLLHVSAPVY